MKIVHYINQFFGQIGGEEMAGHPLEVRKGPFGPGTALQALLGRDAEITATIVCGDNYFVENTEKVQEELRLSGRSWWSSSRLKRPTCWWPGRHSTPADTGWPAEKYAGLRMRSWG